MNTTPEPIFVYFSLDAVGVLAVILLGFLILKKDSNNSLKGNSV